jgi:Uncharacterized protein conserved in bacteria|tara:strand:- start:1322 stop:1813 length:492 start_codon:yes stop_codon:yes gene_type:complete
MHILLKNRKLCFDNYRLKCSIGKRGITNKKREGDKKTPKGVFKFKKVLYRKDRISGLETKLKLIPIKQNMGWCDDINSKFYNKLIRFPSKKSAERLFRKDNIYNIIIVIDFNMSPIIKGKGSAIFIHLATKNYKPTQGCIALNIKGIRLLLKKISKKDKIKII